MMSLQSALLGYAIFLILPKLLPSLFTRPFTVQENVILQTTAVATGTMPLAAGLVGIIPALEMLSEKLDGVAPIVLGWQGLVGWCLAVAFFGYVSSCEPAGVRREGVDEPGVDSTEGHGRASYNGGRTSPAGVAGAEVVITIMLTLAESFLPLLLDDRW